MSALGRHIFLVYTKCPEYVKVHKKKCPSTGNVLAGKCPFSTGRNSFWATAAYFIYYAAAILAIVSLTVFLLCLVSFCAPCSVIRAMSTENCCHLLVKYLPLVIVCFYLFIYLFADNNNHAVAHNNS